MRTDEKLSVVDTLATVPCRDARLGLERFSRDADDEVKKAAARALDKWMAAWGDVVGS